MNEKEIDEDVMEQLTDDEVEELTEQAQVEMFEPTPHPKEQDWWNKEIEPFLMENVERSFREYARKELAELIQTEINYAVTQERERIKLWAKRERVIRYVDEWTEEIIMYEDLLSALTYTNVETTPNTGTDDSSSSN